MIGVTQGVNTSENNCVKLSFYLVVFFQIFNQHHHERLMGINLVDPPLIHWLAHCWILCWLVRAMFTIRSLYQSIEGFK